MAKNMKYFGHIVSNLKQEVSTSVRVQTKLLSMAKTSPEYKTLSDLAGMVEMVRWNVEIMAAQLDTVVDKLTQQIGAINSDAADAAIRKLDMDAIQAEVQQAMKKQYFPGGR